MSPRAFRISSLVMAAVFAAFAAVQYNDPDPARWMAIYGAAALVSAWAAFRPEVWWALPAAVAAVAMAWAAFWTTAILGKAVDLREVFSFSRMIDETVEETRETFGLLIVAAWMVVTTRRALAARRSSSDR